MMQPPQQMGAFQAAPQQPQPQQAPPISAQPSGGVNPPAELLNAILALHGKLVKDGTYDNDEPPAKAAPPAPGKPPANGGAAEKAAHATASAMVPDHAEMPTVQAVAQILTKTKALHPDANLNMDNLAQKITSKLQDFKSGAKPDGEAESKPTSGPSPALLAFKRAAGDD